MSRAQRVSRNLQSPTLVGRSPIQKVLRVMRATHPKPNVTFREPLRPGHQILLATKGRLHIESGGRQIVARRGTWVWLDEGEQAQVCIMEAPCVIYAMNFLAPTLPPPDFDERHQSAGVALMRQWDELYRIWTDASLENAWRLLRVQARLLNILASMATAGQRAVRVDEATGPWWQTEAAMRQDLRRGWDVRSMSLAVKREPADVVRACRHAVGITPLKRLKNLRMSMARSLVRQSAFTFTEIAERIGYPRIHEFSRDYRKHFDATPTRDRARGNQRLLSAPVVVGVESRPTITTLEPPAVDASPIEQVTFLARLKIEQAGTRFSEPSFPGHHFQLNTTGRMRVQTCGHNFEVTPGGMIWLHNDEEFAYEVLEGPRSFYVLNFLAPSLSPPPHEARCVTLPHDKTVPRFAALLRTWQDTTTPQLTRLMRVHAQLLQILDEVLLHVSAAAPVDQEVALWWRIENEMRKDWSRPISVQWMSRLVQRSLATVTRACHRAVGQAPLERVRKIRMQLARGLVWMSTLSMTEIAYRLGYARVQELSRDYHNQWKETPTADRKRFPEIYQRVFGMPFTLPGSTP